MKRLCFYLSILHLKPDFRYSSLTFARLRWSKIADNLADFHFMKKMRFPDCLKKKRTVNTTKRQKLS